MTAKEGNGLISFKHNIVDTKNKKWVEARDTQIPLLMRSFLQKGFSY